MTSVVLSTYNGEKYLLEQLNSLLNQTLKIDEVIISDDCSSDQTVDIIKCFISDNKLSNWVLRVNEKNKGWVRNFVEIISEARGDIIFFCDQDDIWMPHKVETMACIMQNHSEIDVLAGGYIKFEKELPIDMKITNSGARKMQSEAFLTTEFPGCVYCIRRSFWKKIVPYWNSVYTHDGFSCHAAKLFESFYVLETPVIYWRRHPESTYAKYNKQIKSKDNRVKWLIDNRENLVCLEKIANAHAVEQQKINKLKGYKIFVDLRIQLLSKFELLTLFRLLKYIRCYDKKRRLILDVLLSVRK